MSNSLQTLMNTLILPAALPVLREACLLPALVATDFSAVAQEQNAVIRVNKPQNLGPAQDFDPSVGSTSTDLNSDKIDITLNRWKYKQFEMNDLEMRDIITAGVLPSAAESAVKSLANAVDSDLWSLYRDIPYYAGTPGVLPADTDTIVDARKVLQDNLAPLGDRRLVLNTGAEAAYLKNVAKWLETGSVSTAALREAAIGRLYGLDFFTDQLSQSYTPGSAAGSTLSFTNAGSIGAQSIVVGGATGAATLNYGDIFAIAGVYNIDGVTLSSFVVTAPTVAVSGTFANVGIYPALPVAVAAGVGITVLKPGTAAPAPQSLLFHRDAFMFAARTLTNEASENSTISTAVDPVSGIPLRLETWRDPGKAKRNWRFDILYGVRTIRQEFAVRVFG